MTPADLRAWRHRLGLFQREAALRLDVSLRCWVAWERGETRIPLAVKLACRWLEALAVRQPTVYGIIP